MNKIRKGLTWLSVIVFFLLIGICNVKTANAAIVGKGTPEDPFCTNGRSIEKYFFDEYKNKSEVGAAYRKYQAYAGPTNEVWYFRLGDTASLKSRNPELIPLNAEDQKTLRRNEDDKYPLYVCWISYLKRANTERNGTLSECAKNESAIVTEKRTGGGTYYNTFGYGLRPAEIKNWKNASATTSLGLKGDAFVWYKNCKEPDQHYRTYATYKKSADISSFWMYTGGGDWGYTVYYMRYRTAYEFVDDYNLKASNQDQIEKTAYSGYEAYDIYLNGATALHFSSGWRDTATTFAKNNSYLLTLGEDYLDKYADQNYNRHISLRVLRGVPIVVRAWDISTNKLVSMKTEKGSINYMQAFDPALSSIDEGDGVFWDTGSSVHTTDVQQAIMKFLYMQLPTGEGGKVQTIGNVAYDIDGFDNKSMTINSYVRQRNAGNIKEDGAAVLYIPKKEGMTEVKDMTTADAYAPIGFRIFAYEDTTLEKLQKEGYKSLIKYDPVLEGEASGGFLYGGGVYTQNYCLNVERKDYDGRTLRLIDFDIRHDVKTSKGVLSCKGKLEWPQKSNFDNSKNGHRSERAIAATFFSGNALTTEVNSLKEESLKLTVDGTRHIWMRNASDKTLPNGKLARVSIKEAAEGLGSKRSTFELINTKNLEMEDPSCVVIDILVSEMYYEQSTYNIEQLSVLDNKYDTEHGVWGYTGTGEVSVGKLMTADGGTMDKKQNVPALVHTEADDSQTDNTVSVLNVFKKPVNDYLRFDIKDYGKTELTSSNGAGVKSTDGVIYTLEGWSHYISEGNMENTSDSNAGYADSLDAKYKKFEVPDNKFAYNSSAWNACLDAFGDEDDNASDKQISNKLAKQDDVIVDAWAYNLFYVIKPPIVAIVYKYDNSSKTYKVTHVSAVKAGSSAEAKIKAVDKQLQSTGVQGYITYDAGYHRAGDRVTVNIRGNLEYKRYYRSEPCGEYLDEHGVLQTNYETVEYIDGIDLAGAYITDANVNFYNDTYDLPEVGSESTSLNDIENVINAWEQVGLYNYNGKSINEANHTSYPEYHWNSKQGTPAPQPRSNVTYTFNMLEQTTAIVAVYGGPKGPATENIFKMRVQYLQYDGENYKELSLVNLEKKAKTDTYDMDPEIAADPEDILDIGYNVFKQNSVPLSREYFVKPKGSWGQSIDKKYKLYPNENKVVVYVVLKTPPDNSNWLTVVYLDAGDQELPTAGMTTTFTYPYSYYEQYKGVDHAILALSEQDVDAVGVAYGPDLPLYDQIEKDANGILTYKNPSPDTGPGTAWSLQFETRVSRSGLAKNIQLPTVTTDAGGRRISWSRKGQFSYPFTDGIHGNRGCVIYVLKSTQYIPPVPDYRTTVSVTKTVEKLEEHKIDWSKANKTPITGGTAQNENPGWPVLSEADYSNLKISKDEGDMYVYLENDELNSTRAAYDPKISIPTSEFIKQYAKIKKYEREWQYEKVTVTWTFTDITRVGHKEEVEHILCPGNDKPIYDPVTGITTWVDCSPCHHSHICEGNTDVRTSATVTRYTTFYRINYGDVYVPKDITTFNKSFGTFGTKVYNKTLDKFGHATMIMTNTAYQNGSLGFHRLSNADIDIPVFDESKLYTWDYYGHEYIHGCVGTGQHDGYCSGSKENKAACTRRLELAVGKTQLYRSSNEEWIFGDGEGNFTELSNGNLNHDNEMVHNIIEAPPEAEYTVADGQIYSYEGTPDTTKTYSEGCTYAFGKSYNQFFQNAIPVPIDTLNDYYKSKSYVHWQLHSQAKPHTNDEHKIMRIEVDDSIIFTPTVSLDRVIVDNTAVQKIKQNGKTNFTMDNVFRVCIDATGTNCDPKSYPGYGLDNYDRYLNKDVVDDKLEHVGYVKFPFPVIKKSLVEGVTVDTYYKENTWIACKVGETEFIPSYFKEELEDVEVQFMNRAENTLKKNEFSYIAPGTSTSRIHDADNVEDFVQDDLMNGSIPDWERISYPITNGVNVDSWGVHSNYIATDVKPCNLYGRIYGFSIIDQTDYPSWQSTFRNSDGTLSMNKYLSGLQDRDRRLINTDPLKTIATVRGSNKQYINAGVLKPGYAIRYTFETVGELDRENDYVCVYPSFYWINEDGAAEGPVDVYYKEKSSANATAALIKAGSDTDLLNKKVFTLDSFGFGHDYNYYTESRDSADDVSNVKDETGDVDQSGNKLRYSLKLDESKDNLIHASELLTFTSLKEYMEYKEETWSTTITKLPSKMQSYDGLRHATILSSGAEDPFTALKSAVILNQEKLGVSRDDIYKGVQEWYGEYYLPSNIYVTAKGTNVSDYLTKKDSGMELTGKEACWKTNGYLAVKFDIITYRNGERWLAYDNTASQTSEFVYSIGDMWDREAYVKNKTDSSGTTFSLDEGTTVLYQIGYPKGNPEGNPPGGPGTNPSAANDYEGAGTH